MVARPRLTDALVGRQADLILFSAPPGFGKTTLLAQWRQLEKRPFAWLSLDEVDNDPTMLWAGMVEAIRRVRPGFGPDLEVALHAAHVDVRDALVPLVLHELEKSDEELVLLLDDYQFVTNQSCHDSIVFFMEAKPANVQLVLSSRSDPPIPVGRLRAAGKLVELRAVDLCFGAEEESAFLNDALGLGLDEASLALLHAQTEGWPAGVYLASLSLRNAPDAVEFVSVFDGSNRHVVDYLTEVVLGLLEEDQRSFLLQTSILESLSAPLCDAVTQRTDSADRLAELERGNVFLIPLDDRRERYRYHQLFARVLQDQLAQRHADLERELHARAREWFESAGELDDAIHHALAAGDLGDAADLAMREWMASASGHLGRPEGLVRRLEDFPAEAVRVDGGLALLSAWASGMRHERKDMEAALGAVEDDETMLLLHDGTPTEEAAELVRASFPWGDVEHFRSDAEALAARDLSAYSEPVALYSVGWARYLSGAWTDAVEPLEEAAAAGFRAEQWLVAAAAMALVARIALREGDVERASREAEGALELLDIHDLDNQPGAGIARVALGAVLARQGHVEEASILLVRGLAQLRSRGDFLELADALLVYAPVRRSLATLGSARAVVDEANALLADCADPGMLAEEIELVARSLTPTHRRIDGDSDLTERELEVLRYLAEGLSKRDIGRILFLSYNTIHSHTKSIYQKLRVSSRQDAVERAHELGAL